MNTFTAYMIIVTALLTFVAWVLEQLASLPLL